MIIVEEIVLFSVKHMTDFSKNMTVRIRQIFKNMTVRKKTNIQKRLNRERIKKFEKILFK
jgi:hypothetical protein